MTCFFRDYDFPFTFLDDLISICQSYHDRVKNLENEKYDMEKEVEFKDYRVCLCTPLQPIHALYNCTCDARKIYELEEEDDLG